MQKTYNILHVLSTNRLSGAERIVQYIARYLDRQKYHPIILCTGYPLSKIYQREGFSVETLSSTSPTPVNILRLCSLIKRLKIDLIHAHDHRASLFSLICSRIGRQVPVVSHIHSTNPWLKKTHPFKLMEMFLRNRYEVSLACSDMVKKYYCLNNPFANPEKIITFLNGIEIKNPKKFDQNILNDLGIVPDRFIFGTVGRLAEEKGIDVLLRAFNDVADKIADAVLLIVGAGPKETELKDLANELGLGRRVIFAGYREDVENIFPLIDVFVLPSRWEGLPMVLMEAMSFALPVISTDVGGIQELVFPNETGLLIPSGDHHQLAEKMLYLFREQEAAKRLGLAGQHFVREKHNITILIKNLEQIYSNLLGGRNTC
ncbi:MAG: glycosyltransferase family 4 protein [Desulfitobacteriaceae bacterium]|nr:glycosyltransferase family 4 protein [Desulfitobacteriaceae bacterium]